MAIQSITNFQGRMKWFGSSYYPFIIALCVGVLQSRFHSEGQDPSADECTSHLEFIRVGNLDTYDSLPKLEAIGIFWKESEWLESRQDTIEGQNPPHETINHFTLYSKDSQLKLRKETKRDKILWYEYLGYYPSIQCHFFARNSNSESIQFSELCIFDSLTNLVYKVESIGDYRVENPLVSENHQYIAYTYNEMVGSKGTFIGVMKLSRRERTHQLFREYASFRSEQFYVNSIKWSGDSLLLLDVTTIEDYHEYFKIPIP